MISSEEEEEEEEGNGGFGSCQLLLACIGLLCKLERGSPSSNTQSPDHTGPTW